MKHLLTGKRITKYAAAAIAVLLLSTTLMAASVRTSAYVWPDRELELGMTGEDVLSLQARLTELGYTVGELDGYFGGYTQVALMYYQYYNGLYVDGVAGPLTLASLYGTPSDSSNGQTGQSQDTGTGNAGTVTSLSNGSTGDYVVQLQTRLEELGYSTGGADGIFGNMTETAVKAFQKANGLYVDGIVGPVTVEALRSPYAVRNGTSASSNPSGQNNNTSQNSNAGVSSITRELKKGMTGSDVLALQSALDALGYATGGADGDFGAKTEAAVKAFQKAKGLEADGIVGPYTLAALKGTAPAAQSNPSQNNTSYTVITRELKKGMTGDDVNTLQTALEWLGYSTGGVDGDFGAKTEAAVKAFQSAKGLYADGIVGPLTLEALTNSIYGQAQEPAVTVKPPEVDPGFTGFAGNEYGDWYFIDGAVATHKTCLVRISYKGNSGWWYVKEGKVISFIGTPQLTHISLAKGGIIINWEANEGVRKYRVYRKNNAGAWVYLADTANNYYIDTNVVSGSTYTYTVRAVSPDGETNLSNYDETGKTLTYSYQYDSYLKDAPATVTRKMVEDKAKEMGLDENEIIALLAWVEGEAYAKADEPYLAYLSACVLINNIEDGYLGRGEDALKKIESWGSFYTIEKQKARYETVSGDTLLAVYLALNHPVTGIHYCRGSSYKPANCYYDACITAQGSSIYVW